MNDIERLDSGTSHELASPMPIVLGSSEENVRIVQAALNLKAEIDRRNTAVLTMSDSIVPMPNSPGYGAGDVSVIVTELRSINAIMYEVELSPHTPVSYGFTLTLEAVQEGIKLHKDSYRSVTLDRTKECGDDHSFVLRQLTGPHAQRAQEIILKRATRQLRDEF